MNKQTQGKKSPEILDVVGVGIGAFNLSLAALLKRANNLKYSFFDQKDEFGWHNGMLLDNAKLQVHYLKDLASCVDPSNPYTFLSYIISQGRIYQFINRKENTVSRKEFNAYFKWASKQIPNLYFGEKITGIQFKLGNFHITTNKKFILSKHIVLGTGIKPYVPKQFQQFLGTTFFHNNQFKQRMQECNFANKRIAVIGGGQSGAEIFDMLISQKNKPADIIWASKRLNFQTLEDSCFANEYYTPHYVNHFYSLSKQIRQNKLKQQYLTSDGITQELADEIYNKLYELKYVESKKMRFELAPNHTLTNVEKINNQYLLTFYDQDHQRKVCHTSDIVILATGYQSTVPDYLRNIVPGLTDSGDIPVNLDYSVNWLNSSTNKIFVQNAARSTHGVADPNLSLAAWRNSIMINSLIGKEIYKTHVHQHVLGKELFHKNEPENISQINQHLAIAMR